MVEEKVREGYKKTEVGVIPDEWDIKTVRNICEIYGRIGFRGYTVNDIVAKGYGAISLSPSNIIDDKLDTTKCTYISWYKYEESPEIKIYNGDVLLVKTGSTYGKVACVSGLNEKATINPQLVVFKNIKVNNIYFGYLMNSKVAKEQINSAIVGGAIPTLSQEQIYNFIFPIPNDINEQKGIADALNGVDKLLQSLEKLIEKKKKIKQGTMQQLLTGKKRLPGFSGEWEVTCIKDLLDYEQPTKYIIKSDILEKATIPVLTANKSFILGFTEENFGVYENLPVIIFDDFTTLSKKVNFKFKVKSSAMKMLKAKNKNINLEFLYEIMQLIKFTLGDHKRYYLSEYQYIEIKLPNLEEQNAIFNVLGDMDFEIEALERKLTKYKKIKQGMMQELLTGRIRLI